MLQNGLKTMSGMRTSNKYHTTMAPANDEGDKVSGSSHYTTHEGRLYDSTLPFRQSYDTHRLKDSVKSASFVGNKDHGSFGEQTATKLYAPVDSPMRYMLSP